MIGGRGGDGGIEVGRAGWSGRKSYSNVSPSHTSSTGLRARAIAFIQIQQPLRIATKSNKYGGGKAPKQKHMLSIWQQLMVVAERMENNPEFLLNSGYFIFDSVSDIITESCKHYRESKVCNLLLC